MPGARRREAARRPAPAPGGASRRARAARGAPVADACRQLNERLAPYRARLPGVAFKEVVSAAYLERVDLSAHGFYATPDITGARRGPPHPG